MTLSVVGIFGLGVVLLVVATVLLVDMMMLLLPVMVATAVSRGCCHYRMCPITT